jgi:hypothetical protein
MRKSVLDYSVLTGLLETGAWRRKHRCENSQPVAAVVAKTDLRGFHTFLSFSELYLVTPRRNLLSIL